jgi:hypothetical protein
MRRRAVVAALACSVVVAGMSTAAPRTLDGDLAAAQIAAQRDKKKFRRFYNFRLTGDGCLSSMSKKQLRVPRFIFFGTFEDPLDPDVSAFVGMWIDVCMPGFDPARDVSVRMVAPDARVAELVLPAQGRTGLHSFDWIADPAAPLGLYTFEAQQGNSRARGSLDLGPATRPDLGSRYEGVRLGESLPVFFTGFPAREQVRIGVYRALKRVRARCPGQRRLHPDYMAYCFTGQVFKASIDANGNGAAALRARRGTMPPGSYALKALAPSVRGVIHGPQFGVCRARHPNRYCSDPEFDELLLP